MPGLDAARVLATLGVVWVHTFESQNQSAEAVTLGRFGTSFYVFAAVFLTARIHIKNPQADPVVVSLRRAKRLLLPFVLWSAIYAVFYVVTMRPQGHPWAAITRYWGPLYGTAIHLWFLPFAFVAGVLSSLLTPWLMRLSQVVLWSSACALTLGLYVQIYGWGYAQLDETRFVALRLHRLTRWVEEVPLVAWALSASVLYGKNLGRISRWGSAKRRKLALLCCVGFVATEICYVTVLADLGPLFWNRVRFLAHLAGFFWICTFLAARSGPVIERFAPLGTATYFAYLVHQLVLDAIKVPLRQLPGHGTLFFALSSTLLVFLISVLLGVVVSRVRGLRWLSP